MEISVHWSAWFVRRLWFHQQSLEPRRQDGSEMWNLWNNQTISLILQTLPSEWQGRHSPYCVKARCEHLHAFSLQPAQTGIRLLQLGFFFMHEGFESRGNYENSVSPRCLLFLKWIREIHRSCTSGSIQIVNLAPIRFWRDKRDYPSSTIRCHPKWHWTILGILCVDRNGGIHASY